MTETLTISIISILALLNILTLVWVIFIHKRIKKLTLGKSAESLEQVITENNSQIQHIKQKQGEHGADITKLQKQIKKSIQHISVTRFDALNEMGGKQSFAIGLIDEHKNGVVISSMYTRDRMNVFAKEITKGTSKHTLTKEEESVIN